MNEQERQVFATEWHERFQHIQEEAASRSTLNEIEQLLAVATTFSFFAGVEAAKYILQGEANKEDLVPVCMNLTVQEMFGALAEAGMDLKRLNKLQELLRQGSNPEH